MKVSDYIVDYFVDKGICDMFGYPGALVCHLMDSAAKMPEMQLHLNYHEQAAAFAACGYALVANKPGIAYSNGGPGVTNMVTGIANAWYDSIPTIFITGQVDTTAMIGELPIRQRGIQELPTRRLVEPICKYVAFVKSPKEIRYFIERAYWEAISGRPGPVVLEIPADVMRAMVDIEELEGFEAGIKRMVAEEKIDWVFEALRRAKRPSLLFGNGIRVSGNEDLLKRVVEKLRIPALSSLPAIDVLPFDFPLYFGFIGNNGNRYSNYILAKSDLIICIGARLDIKQVGAERNAFVPNARLIRVDVDNNELTYKVNESEEQLQMSAFDFLSSLYERGAALETEDWLSVCRTIKKELYGYDFKAYHKLLQVVCEKAPERCSFTADVGHHEIYLAQVLKLKDQQKLLLSMGLASMGFGLPAAIGAYYGYNAPVFCVCGDGGFQMNLQELQYISSTQIPVKIVVFNNYALGMIREFQERNFESVYTQSVSEGGYSAPNIAAIAHAYGLPYHRVSNLQEAHELRLEENRPEVIELIVEESTVLFPRFQKGAGIEVMVPELDKLKHIEYMNM